MPSHATDTEQKEIENLRLAECEQKVRFLQEMCRTLLLFIRDFSLAEEVADNATFHRTMDSLNAKLQGDLRLVDLQSFWERHHKTIIQFIETQKEFVHSREGGLKEIIDMLSGSLTDNQRFNQKVREQADKVEWLSRGDDLGRLKSSLKEEISTIRDTVKDKEYADGKRIEELTSQVEALKKELKSVSMDALRDGLTGLYNRQALERFLMTHLAGNPDARSIFSVLYLGIDHFPNITESYGKAFGNRVVLAIAQEINQLAGSRDFLARLPDEQFVVILPTVPLKPALKKARYLCKQIAASRYTVDDVQNGHQLSFSVSIGVATRKAHDSAGGIMERAGKALEAAKRAGGNRAASEKANYLLFLKEKITILERI
jgi:diguanylate cyclase